MLLVANLFCVNCDKILNTSACKHSESLSIPNGAKMDLLMFTNKETFVSEQLHDPWLAICRSAILSKEK